MSFADEADDEGGPAGLVGGAKAFAGFGVEVFVEEKVVVPERVAPVRMMGADEVT